MDRTRRSVLESGGPEGFFNFFSAFQGTFFNFLKFLNCFFSQRYYRNGFAFAMIPLWPSRSVTTPRPQGSVLDLFRPKPFSLQEVGNGWWHVVRASWRRIRHSSEHHVVTPTSCPTRALRPTTGSSANELSDCTTLGPPSAHTHCELPIVHMHPHD